MTTKPARGSRTERARVDRAFIVRYTDEMSPMPGLERTFKGRCSSPPLIRGEQNRRAVRLADSLSQRCSNIGLPGEKMLHRDHTPAPGGVSDRRVSFRR